MGEATVYPKMNFVFVSLQRINTDRESTSTSLAKELARQQHNVLYVNSPVNRKDFLIPPQDPFVAAHLRAIKLKTNPLQQLAPNLWVLYPSRPIDSFNWVSSTTLFAWLIKFNNLRFAQEIKSALKELEFNNFIVINDKDIFRSFYLKQFLNPSKYIYLDRDYTLGLAYWQRHGHILEPKLMRKADAVLCNSLDFASRARRYNPNSFYIGNGFNAEQFLGAQTSYIPEDLAAIPSPRIGYVGALIKLRLDLTLLIDLANARPRWNFIFIGWEDEAFKKSVLHTLPNVFFLGQKHTKDVPPYLLHFDVCINPQKINDITESNFPLKILEYLAVGKPVVATTTSTMTEVFSEHTYLATNASEYLIQIENALNNNLPQLAQERINFAKKFSWKKVAELLVKIIQDI